MRETAHEIDQAAAEWVAKVDRGLSTEEQFDLDAWLDADPRRTGAFGRLRAIALRTERAVALGPDFQPSNFTRSPSAKPSRRGLLIGGGAVAAGVAASLLARLSLLHDRLQTRKGEVRQFALKDGSVVTLNTSSAVALSFSQHLRKVRLLGGEALFDVAHDKARPFVVLAGATSIRAIGTSFTVRHLPDEAVQVLVSDGVVEVSRTDATPPRPMRVSAGMRAVSTANGSAGAAMALSATAVSETELHRALAWREGHLAFEGETLAAAANEFARYSDTRIVVEDPALAREEIAGLYQATDPVGFAQSVASSLDAQTEVSEGKVRIFRRAS